MVVLKIQEQKKYISNIKIIKYNNNFYVNKNIFNKLDNKTLYNNKIINYVYNCELQGEIKYNNFYYKNNKTLTNITINFYIIENKREPYNNIFTIINNNIFNHDESITSGILYAIKLYNKLR